MVAWRHCGAHTRSVAATDGRADNWRYAGQTLIHSLQAVPSDSVTARSRQGLSTPCPAQVVGAPGGLPAEALRGPPSRYALRWTAFAWTQSEGWAHFEFTRINTTPTILPKKLEDLRESAACVGPNVDHPRGQSVGRFVKQRRRCGVDRRVVSEDRHVRAPW